MTETDYDELIAQLRMHRENLLVASHRLDKEEYMTLDLCFDCCEIIIGEHLSDWCKVLEVITA